MIIYNWAMPAHCPLMMVIWAIIGHGQCEMYGVLCSLKGSSEIFMVKIRLGFVADGWDWISSKGSLYDLLWNENLKRSRERVCCVYLMVGHLFVCVKLNRYCIILQGIVHRVLLHIMACGEVWVWVLYKDTSKVILFMYWCIGGQGMMYLWIGMFCSLWYWTGCFSDSRQICF